MKRAKWAVAGLWIVLCVAPIGCAADRHKGPGRVQDADNGSSRNDPAADRHKGPGRVYDSDNGFSIVPPAGWKSIGPFMGRFMTYTGPVEDGATVNFIVGVQKDSATAQEVLDKAKAALPKLLTDYQAVDEGFTTIDGKAAFSLSGRFVQGQFALQNLQYGVSTGAGKFYVITFTAPTSVFEKYRPTFEATARTARID